MYYRGFKAADGFVVQNDHQFELCRQVTNKPIRVIPNGLLPSDNPASGHGGYVIWIGALRDVKRPDLFINLARRIPDAEFVMVGGGTSTEPSYAEDIARTAGDVPNLKLAGRRSHAETLEYIRNASLLVNTSRVEGFPNAYLEAWNYGIPAVSFNDVDGLIDKEQLGIVCPHLDEMESAVRSLLQDRNRLQVMGERARRLVAERFSANVLGREYVAFFAELLNTKSSGV
jgi:glycosyltransferase involved in cell wall biosynthesis